MLIEIDINQYFDSLRYNYQTEGFGENNGFNGFTSAPGPQKLGDRIHVQVFTDMDMHICK